jgi:XRE family transcriptional regulator, regulator of sulfur utilization
MSAETFQNIAHNLVHLRKSRGLTQMQLAQASGIPRTTLSYMESGSSNPSLKLLMTLASILGVTLEELIASPRPSCFLSKRSDLKSQIRSKGQAEKIILLPDSPSGLQFERLDLKPQGVLVGTPHS